MAWKSATAQRIGVVSWPSGGTDVVERVPTNRLLTIAEGQGLRRQQPFQGR